MKSSFNYIFPGLSNGKLFQGVFPLKVRLLLETKMKKVKMEGRKKGRTDKNVYVTPFSQSA